MKLYELIFQNYNQETGQQRSQTLQGPIERREYKSATPNSGHASHSKLDGRQEETRTSENISLLLTALNSASTQLGCQSISLNLCVWVGIKGINASIFCFTDLTRGGLVLTTKGYHVSYLSCHLFSCPLRTGLC